MRTLKESVGSGGVEMEREREREERDGMVVVVVGVVDRWNDSEDDENQMITHIYRKRTHCTRVFWSE
jgi:hypothetical protein